METLFNKSVAIVGNASSIFDYSYGADIDAHDIVVRINKGAFFDSKYSQQLGTKFNVWCIQNVFGQRKKIHLPEMKTIYIMQMDTIKVNRYGINRIDYVYPTNMYDELVQKAGLKKKPSTGLKVIDYIISLQPKQMTVYGFDFNYSKTWYETRTDQPHDFEGEKQYCQYLLSKHANMRLEMKSDNKQDRKQQYIDLYKQFYGAGGYGKRPHHQTLVAKDRIKSALKKTGSTTMLDYGCGDGLQYKRYGLKEFFNLQEIYCYDPGVEEFEIKPNKSFDAVINTDVMEHIPIGVDREVIAEIFTFATKMVYFRIATSPAKNKLPNGENAHCNLKTHEEWVKLIKKFVKPHQYVVIETTGNHKGITELNGSIF